MGVRPQWSSALRHRWENEGERGWLKLLDYFEKEFGAALLFALDIPGRICILGDHSDYVPYLSSTIIAFASDNQRMKVLISPREDGDIRIGSSLGGCETTEFDVDDDVIEGDWLESLDKRGGPDPHWSNYIRGAVAYVRRETGIRYGFDLFVHSSIPPASGASSSSALTLAGLVAINLSNGLGWTRDSLTLAGGEAEWYVGTRGGMMDHATMMFGEEEAFLKLQFNPFRVTKIVNGIQRYKWYSVFTHAADKGGQMREAFNELAYVQQSEIAPLLDEVGFEHGVGVQNGVQYLIDGEFVGWEEIADMLPEFVERGLFGKVRVRDRFAFVMREYSRANSFANYVECCEIGGVVKAINGAWADTRDLLRTHTPEMELVADSIRGKSGVLGLKVLGAGFGGNLLLLAENGADLGGSAVEHAPGRGLNLVGDLDYEINEKCAAILLCGGKGSRMAGEGVEVHKPLIPIGGVPSLIRVINQLKGSGVGFEQMLIVVPQDREEEYVAALAGMGCDIVVQPNALGTGDAVHVALARINQSVEHVYVSFGTQPLVQNATIWASLNYQIENNLGFTLPTTITPNPYAPLIRDEMGNVSDSVETHLEGAEKPATGEANIGAYWATKEVLDSVLVSLVDEKWNGVNYDTPSGELGYPNEMVRACLAAGVSVDGVPCAEPSEMVGIKRMGDVHTVERCLELRNRYSKS